LAQDQTCLRAKAQVFAFASSWPVPKFQIANQMGGFSAETHANRMEAQIMAKLILEYAEHRNKPVSDADVLEVLRLWFFSEGITQEGATREDMGCTLGLLSSHGGSVTVSAATKHYPAVPNLLCRWLRDHMPQDLQGSVSFTSVNIKSGTATAFHCDGNGEGPSVIAAFGRFTGGELVVWPKNEQAKATLEKVRDEEQVTFDLRHNSILFDGNGRRSLKDFEGERFIIEYFSVGESYKASVAHREELTQAGFNFREGGSLESMDRASIAMRQPLRSWPRSTKKVPNYFFLTAQQIHEAKEMAKLVEPRATEAAPMAEEPMERTPPHGSKRLAVLGGTDCGGSNDSEQPSSKKLRRDPSPDGKKAIATKTAATPAMVPKGPQIDKKEAMQQLCRCTESTPISYVPGGKTASSHRGSYERYERYAQATTLKEALELGACAGDMLYDIQAGLLIIPESESLGPVPKAEKFGKEAGAGRFGRLRTKWVTALEQM